MTTAQRIYYKLNRELKYTCRDSVHLLGLDRSLHNNARGSRILIYHGISPQNYSRFNPVFLKLKTFEEHLKFYKKHYNIVSLDDLYRHRESKNKFNICLTFDDGFANNYQYVLPLLKQYEAPATFFITAIRQAGYDVLWNDFLTIVSKYGPASLKYKKQLYYKNKHNRYLSAQSGISLAHELRYTGFDEKAEMMRELYALEPFKENGFDPDLWLQMTAEQIKELSASPWATVGAHGYYHNDLAKIGIDSASAEMIQSKSYLENVIQQPVNSLAFPYGSYTPQVIDAAKKAGYNQLLAMDFQYPGDIKDDTMKERFTINPYISVVNQMHATITGTYVI